MTQNQRITELWLSSKCIYTPHYAMGHGTNLEIYPHIIYSVFIWYQLPTEIRSTKISSIDHLISPLILFHLPLPTMTEETYCDLCNDEQIY